MSDREPVNIMGVIAFPDPDVENRRIRFIDSHYNTLFSLRDGESIVVTAFDGSQTTHKCTYIDDYHTQIGNSVYHICEFAEAMERGGAIYAPEKPQKEATFGSYEVYQISDVGGVSYCFLNYERAKQQIRPTDYRRVYAGVLAEKATLDDLYTKHNHDSRPFGQRMRSMSVSDIVVLHRGGSTKAYYVDSIGFQELKQFSQKTRTAPKKERGEAR